MNNEVLLEAFNKKLYPVEVDETDHQKVKRCMAQERAKVELKYVLDAISGKRLPVAQIRSDYLQRASSKFGGFISSNLSVDALMLRSIFDDPGSYKTLRVSVDRVTEVEAVEARETPDGRTVHVRKQSATKEPTSFGELVLVLAGWLTAVEVAIDSKVGAIWPTSQKYLAYLSKVLLTSGEAACLAVDKSFRKRLSTLSHRLSQMENKSYSESVGMVLSRVEEFAATDLVCLSALKPLPTRSGSGQAPESRVASTTSGERGRSGKCKFFKEECPYLPKKKCIFFPWQHDSKSQGSKVDGPGKRKRE
ncbi:hypothetical protein FOL47_003920, partial [Perkinsus chesapeaki]